MWEEKWLAYALAGGDDYELAFTAPARARTAVLAAGAQTNVRVTCIGQIDAKMGIRLLDAQGQIQPGDYGSFDHFA